MRRAVGETCKGEFSRSRLGLSARGSGVRRRGRGENILRPSSSTANEGYTEEKQSGNHECQYRANIIVLKVLYLQLCEAQNLSRLLAQLYVLSFWWSSSLLLPRCHLRHAAFHHITSLLCFAQLSIVSTYGKLQASSSPEQTRLPIIRLNSRGWGCSYPGSFPVHIVIDLHTSCSLSR